MDELRSWQERQQQMQRQFVTNYGWLLENHKISKDPSDSEVDYKTLAIALSSDQVGKNWGTKNTTELLASGLTG